MLRDRGKSRGEERGLEGMDVERAREHTIDKIESRDSGQEREHQILQELEDLVGQLDLVLYLRVSVSGSSVRHSGNLILNVHPESLSKLHHQSLQVYVASIRDQGLEAVQIVVHHLISLVVECSLQDIYSVNLYIDQKELSSEVLVEVSPGLQRKHTSVWFLLKEIFGPFCGPTSFEKY